MVQFWKKAAMATAAGAMALAAAAPAQARWHGGYGGYHGGWHGGYGYHGWHHGGGRTSAALLGGIVGLGVGAAIASRPYYGYGRPYYRGGYYGGPYYSGYYAEPYYPAPRCWIEQRGDPYYGSRPVRVCE